MRRSAIVFLSILLPLNLFSQSNYWNRPSMVTRDMFQSLVENWFDYETRDYLYGFTANGEYYILAYRIEDEHSWITEEKDKANGRIDNKRWISYRQDTTTKVWTKFESTVHWVSSDSYLRESSTQTTKRDLILYRSSGGGVWTEASNTVQTDYRIAGWKFDFGVEPATIDNFDYHSYLITKGLGSGKVRVLDNGCIVLLMHNEYNRHLQYYNAVAILVPNGDKTYTATRFEPLVKETRVPELQAGDSLIIHETDNGIKLEFWDRYVCEEDDNPDGYINYDSDTGGRVHKVFYRRKLFTTLTFSMRDGLVYYSGDYLMTQKY